MQGLTIVITTPLVLLFLYTGISKLLGSAESVGFRDHLGVPAARWRLVGLLEAGGAAGLLLGFVVPALGIVAAGGLALLMSGAIVTHLRIGDPPRAAALAALALAFAAILLGVQIGALW